MSPGIARVFYGKTTISNGRDCISGVGMAGKVL